jgi:RimJ/RimL family protein N-acetyltransferase
MQEIRTAKVNGREVSIMISDEREALLAAKAAGRAIVGLWRPENMEDLSGLSRYLVEDMDAVTEEFLERVARRELGYPWHICRTDRLLIREICGDDFDEIWNSHMAGGFDSVEALESYTKNQYGFYEFGFWSLVEKASGELVGIAGVTVPEKAEGTEEVWELRIPRAGDAFEAGEADPELEPVELELGYHIFTPFRRQGYARESCLAILEYAKRELMADRIVLRIAKENLPSKHLAASLGFVRIEKIKKAK